ncbi:hypothetical protein BOS5A_130144 [Bosea sp. EC-HK365B]|nr:hypothetical protein BOSE21B_111185 [Bosea sp. 21B]CAD5272735.1 hypothetical protein BOSE7B_30210 [Bosea sp. 7B]VVT56038.1 hypothetical protein BOS5A_130144 [Bosea sp. EC-HK365B]VXC71163.1 hypothetical protein BOSE127_40208 [Bosea sp. 127]
MDQHLGTLCDQAFGHGVANAGRRAGDENGLALQSAHVVSPFGSAALVACERGAVMTRIRAGHPGVSTVMLALVASIHVLDTSLQEGRRGWSGQARP